MTGLERIRRTIAARQTDRIPYAPLFGAYSIAYADAGDESAYGDAGIQTDALIRTAEAHRSDAVFTLMDLSAEPETLGAGIASGVDRRPVVTRHLALSEIANAKVEQQILTARIPVFLDVVRGLRQRVGNELLVGALVSGPFTALCNTVGISTAARMLRRERGLLTELLERFGAACIALSQAYADAGAHAVVLLEPCATPTILGPKDLCGLLTPHLQRCAAAFRASRLVSVLHVCGDTTVSLPVLSTAGFDVLSLDAPVDLLTARDGACAKTTVMGNIDVRQLLSRAAPDQVRCAVLQLSSSMRSGGKFVLSTGCEIPPDTPPENVRALSLSLPSI